MRLRTFPAKKRKELNGISHKFQSKLTIELCIKAL